MVFTISSPVKKSRKFAIGNIDFGGMNCSAAEILHKPNQKEQAVAANGSAVCKVPSFQVLSSGLTIS